MFHGMASRGRAEGSAPVDQIRKQTRTTAALTSASIENLRHYRRGRLRRGNAREPVGELIGQPCIRGRTDILGDRAAVSECARWLSRKPRQPAFRCVEVTTARSRRRSIESNEGVDCCETASREVGPDLPGRAIVTGQQRDLFVRQRPRTAELTPS